MMKVKNTDMKHTCKKKKECTHNLSIISCLSSNMFSVFFSLQQHSFASNIFTVMQVHVTSVHFSVIGT